MKTTLYSRLRIAVRVPIFAALLVTAAGSLAGQTPATTAAPGAVAQNTAIQPEPRDAKWIERHEGFVAEAKRGGIEVLFLGDSITDFWRDTNPNRGGRSVWDREFAPLHAANFGISADRTQHVLWRLDHGEIDGIHPKVVVLMIGTNNTGLERDNRTPRNTPEEALAACRRFSTSCAPNCRRRKSCCSRSFRAARIRTIRSGPRSRSSIVDCRPRPMAG